MAKRLFPLDRRHVRRQVEVGGEPFQVLTFDVGREGRPLHVLFSVQPDRHRHLQSPAPVEVALLVERSHAADARPLAHGHRGGVAGMPHRGQPHLPFGGRRAAERRDAAVRPWLFGDPGQRIVAVGARPAQNLPVAFGEEPAAFVLDDEGVAALDRVQAVLEQRAWPFRIRPRQWAEVVRRAPEDRRYRALRVTGPVDLGGETHAVAHRYHHHAVDRGLSLEVGAADWIRCAVDLRLERRHGRDEHDEEQEQDRVSTHGGVLLEAAGVGVGQLHHGFGSGPGCSDGRLVRGQR